MEIVDIVIVVFIGLLIIANWKDIKPRNKGGEE